MRVLYILIAVLLLVVGVVVGFFVREFSLTGDVVKDLDEYSYTRAVCSGEGCIDVIVSCENGDVVEIEPIFYLVEQEEEWIDPRESEGFCEGG